MDNESPISSLLMNCGARTHGRSSNKFMAATDAAATVVSPHSVWDTGYQKLSSVISCAVLPARQAAPLVLRPKFIMFTLLREQFWTGICSLSKCGDLRTSGNASSPRRLTTTRLANLIGAQCSARGRLKGLWRIQKAIPGKNLECGLHSIAPKS